jgi:hypothetical protein
MFKPHPWQQLWSLPGNRRMTTAVQLLPIMWSLMTGRSLLLMVTEVNTSSTNCSLKQPTGIQIRLTDEFVPFVLGTYRMWHLNHIIRYYVLSVLDIVVQLQTAGCRQCIILIHPHANSMLSAPDDA